MAKALRFFLIVYGYLEDINVDQLKRAERPGHWDDDQRKIKTFKDEKDPIYLENYQTCINFIRLLWHMAQVLGM